MTYAPTAADKWDVLATKFQNLAVSAGGPLLWASSIRDETLGQDVVAWFVQDAASDTLRELFKSLAADASHAIGGVPNDTTLLNLWLHRLYQFLCDQSSPNKSHTIASLLEPDGTRLSVELPMINMVCASSQAFCLNLKLQAMEGEGKRDNLEEHFRSWIAHNSSEPEHFYSSSAFSIRNLVSSVARCAKTSIPIDFLSTRLNVCRLPHLPCEFDSLRAYFDHVAKEEGLMWCITERGLWMALRPPKDGVYIDADGKQRGDTPFRWAEIDAIATERMSQLEATIQKEVLDRLRPFPVSIGDRKRFFVMLIDEANDWVRRADEAFGQCLAEVGREWSHRVTPLIWNYGLNDFIAGPIRGLLLLSCGLDEEKKELSLFRPSKKYTTPPDILDARILVREAERVVESLAKTWHATLSQRASLDHTSWSNRAQTLLHSLDPLKHPAVLPVRPIPPPAISWALEPIEASVRADNLKGTTFKTEPALQSVSSNMCRVSPDYRSIKFNGNDYTLTRSQSRMMKVLWESRESGHPAVSKDRLLEAIENETSEVRDTWKNSELWKTLIVSVRQGVYKLNLP